VTRDSYYGCPVVEHDNHGRTWVCMAPAGHAGYCFLDQIDGPVMHDDMGGQST
jgi:hypothetical protein